ncbi:MAG: TonB-dependent receptor [Acidobacteria bacterium]|nr:TonB-dependent receptor [Acidobacteriota bacterium]
MRTIAWVPALLLSFSFSSFAQTPGPTAPDSPQIPARQESVVVVGSFEPVPLSENDRSVDFFEVRETPLLFNTAVDYLELDPAIDLRERAPGGVQADLSILGSTFAQTLVLVNGLRMNDAQTAHHNLDLPVPLESISRIEVLRGAGSTLYGADAMGGAVNFITAPAEASELRLRAGVGNDGFNQERIFGSLLQKRWSQTISASRDFSTGFRPDRDYRSSSLSSQTNFRSALGNTNILLAGSDKPFGADQFYGPYPSWERTKGWFASAYQELGTQTAASFGYRRHTDDFVLFRDQPEIYENNHISQSWQGALRRHDELGRNTTLSYGAEGQWDDIASNNLGNHARNREGIYANLDFRALRRFSLSVGGREEFFSGGQTVFTPSVAGGVWLHSVKLHASVSRGFRLPTYTDLYYHDPATLGNPLLKPESAWSFEAGGDWNPAGRITAGATLFQRWDSNLIDYVKYDPSEPWQAMNVQRLHFSGAEGHVRFRLRGHQEIELSETYLHGSQTQLSGATSRYVFDYPSHNARFTWTGSWRNLLVARTRVAALQRFQHGTYALWDVSLARPSGWLRPYLQFANLGNTSYEEIPGVVMPGRTVIGGVEFVWARK